MSSDSLVVRGAREHNLKDITVEIPRDSLTVITGLSGSGKSSLAFDTIYAEGQRRYVESLSAYARQFLGLMEKPDVDVIEAAKKQGFVRVRVDGEPYDLAQVPKLNRRQNHDIAVVVDRLVVRRTDRSRLADSIETALKAADGTVEVVHGAKSTLFSERYACPTCGLSLSELEPRQFSFNSPFGACPDCSGLGTRREVSPDLVLGDPSLSILEGVILPWGEPSGYVRKVILPSLARTFKFDLNTPWRDLPATVKKGVLSGAPGKTLTFQYDSERWHGEYESGWDGVLKHVERRYRETASDSVRGQLAEDMIEQPG